MEPGGSRRRSAAEPVAARGRKAPQGPHGQKDFIPDGSAEQAEKLRRCREEQWQLLSEERVERLRSLVKAEWKPGQGIVELQSPAGKFWHTMGFTERGKQCLLPEEALYLLECGSVQLFYRDLPLSIQEAYEILLCQEAMSLPHYQVFSHLKQLGYIVLRFDPSTVLSPYERQLNLESHCQSSGKHHRKRRRSSSPRSHEKKHKVSEDLPEAEETSKKAGDDCQDSSCLPTDEKHLSEQPKESDAGSGKGESNPVPLDTGQKDSLSPSWSRVGDHEESSAGTHASRWDFSTIILPNVAPDQPCTHLPSPDNGLLPENVPGREVNAAYWCARINQKQEKLSRKEREQRERESRYKTSVNADREVRRCSNWQEYKALLAQRSRQRVWRRPPHLWDQAVTPLLRPDEATSQAALLQQISVLQPSHILDGASRLQEDPESMKIDFNVYQADAVAKFKKTNPGKPYVRMCVRSFDEQIPSLRALKQDFWCQDTTARKMRRFLRPGHDPVRERLKRDLFQFNKTVEHGFPHQPSALGYSPFLRLMAIGTRSGAIKLYGAPGVEFMGLHEENNTVMQIHFIPDQCQLVTLLDDNSLHLWSLKQHSGASELREEHRFTLKGPPGSPPSATQITAVLPHSSREVLYLGTESGNIFVVELPSFRVLEDRTITSEAVLQRVPEDYCNRRSCELVEALREHPKNPDQILIGYSRGLIVLWDLQNNKVTHHFLGSQQLENLYWQRDGSKFISCHYDGSYTQWPVSSDNRQPEPLENHVPYGPFPCKAISKIYWQTTKNGLPYIIFQGGMPRASYGDRHSISVVHGSQQTAFDFTSRVIDFFIIFSSEPTAEFDDPSAMVVLAEEELVVIDLKTAGWPAVHPPYLASLHCSAITCSHHVSNIPLKLWERIISAGSKQNIHYSNMPWPIDGGTNIAPDPPQRDLLLTGHEDGTVRFWDASGVCLHLLYKLSTVRVFLTDADPNDNMNTLGEDEWPPLRKVGTFDPYSDDPRLGIQKIYLCKYSGYLAVAGTAGQVLVMELNDEDAEHVVDHAEADLLQDQEGYRWKGHEKLKARDGPVRFEAGFQPFVLVQCQPPAVVTSLALHSEWKLVAFGTSHGFGLFDHQQKRLVFVKCTLHPSDQLALEGPLSRVKSLKKSLRQSFRRIRRSRVSSRKRRGGSGNASEVQEVNAKFDQDALQEMELAPVQRKIEARSAEDSFTGFVRTLYFADTFLRDSSRHCPSLWAGTNGGTVYAFCLRVPPAERRMDEPVRAEQAKEIQLMHRAPVVGILVLDGHSTPLPEPLEVAHDLSKSPDMQGSHQLLVVSEEQFKVFTLPKVSSKLKLKLTALEGCRVRKVTVANFGSCKTDDYSENDLAVLTNLGDIQIISLPFLKLQIRYPCIRKEDVSGIASCVFTKYGQGFYLISPSEFERFSLSTKWLVEPRCVVDVPEITSNNHMHNKSGMENAARKSRGSGRSSGDYGEDEVLKEIQSTLEGGRGSYAERNLARNPLGHGLSNGGAD
ncbi:LLGL scribble cell polarity complex component 2-like isoform 2-T2 [Alca torda]